MSTKRAGIAVAAAGVIATVGVGVLHDYRNIAIGLFVIALVILSYARVVYAKPDQRKPPTQSGGPGGAGGSASVGGAGTAIGGAGGRSGDVIERKDG